MSGWISVYDRLPEETKPSSRVLVIYHYGRSVTGTGLTFFYEGGFSDYRCVGYWVSHWMPIPELPEEL